VIFGAVVQTVRGVLRAFEMFRMLATFDLSAAAIQFVLIVLLLWGVGGPAAVIGGQVSASVVMAFVGAAMVRRVSQLLGPTGDASLRGYRRSITWFLFSTNVNALLGLVTKQGDLIFLGLLRNPVDAGYYRFAKTLAAVISHVGDAVTTAVLPQLTRFWTSERGMLGPFLRSITMLLAGMLIPASLVAIALAEPVVRLVGGGRFDPSVPAVRILIVGFAVAGILSWTRPALLAAGRPHVATFINLFVAALQVALAPVLVPRFGFIASAGILTLLYAVGTSLMAVTVSRMVLISATEVRAHD
jgi:O-antigen/teichoic acid export membrane protein